ncbi:MAG TPA: DedA family protein [Fimbriimonadaceae bacterium]|nr:DedA family protein [Fimbriimonadaceae bacterium]
MSFQEILDFFLHLDKHLVELINSYGGWIYGILFAIVFCETGLVITPFLPGDSLLFAVGIISARPNSGLNVWLVSLTLVSAALIGDNVNYFLGNKLGRRLFKSETSKIFNRKHLDRTHFFFEKYGAKAIIIGRFVPIVRTFGPFVAGMGAMNYSRFIGYSIAAALLWVTVCVGAGYLFGGLPFVRDNFTVALLAMIAVSLIPMIIEVVRHMRMSRKEREEKPGLLP